MKPGRGGGVQVVHHDTGGPLKGVGRAADFPDSFAILRLRGQNPEILGNIFEKLGCFGSKDLKRFLVNIEGFRLDWIPWRI